jgi:hypothetical protein
MEDVIRMITHFENENAARRMVLQFAALTGAERDKYKYHLEWNARIVEQLSHLL